MARYWSAASIFIALLVSTVARTSDPVLVAIFRITAAIAAVILKMATNTGSLVLATVLTSSAINILAADQYLAIVIPGRMYKATYDERGLEPRLLSRTLEDAGTLTSSLIPWNTCGAYMQSVLLVSPLAYAPYAFLNLINPVVAVFYAYTGITIKKPSTAK